ncbi:interferon alpha-inducible protein 27-like protein 2A isoform X1 [Echinops telfairi]|uniref:Interferon alpha-inducible protein 27-like protein 2A isoform X1 n=2 Tax=Echinops telfairi TaxID=9371 RepID=A0AC55CX31_ECHTE|nr:interferon alpha-inducible protein 27-like protein 2A isoform X1 [Echinops telfairi]
MEADTPHLLVLFFREVIQRGLTCTMVFWSAMIGGAVAVASAPVVLSAVGFTGAGIAASSIAAKMMSAAAIANGGGIAAGSLVATLQSVGAVGLSLTAKAILASTGCTLGALLVP